MLVYQIHLIIFYRSWMNNDVYRSRQILEVLGITTRNTQNPIKRKVSKIGRNDPCPCKKGKKYKHCCGSGK